MNPVNDNDKPVEPPVACPICGKPALVRFKPFCSKRCADVDLNRWMKGVYAIPAREDDQGDDDDQG
ncbi:DNA gyrase inhibitor YacG [Phreatobacter aquaticus]|uniref:DNA gyrase inhibitor YacG n=1 Tax=Phreatobacter aquaticus TaxID=2570229 RepID=A0A4D7QM96_9HYPH|nr:DNA gyrase inhibitor YacG [Phreatobacter aquaticus]QCK86227.1 DNA gyrase inhibitor YacG [Phreatobacter aquaticus]